MTETNDQREHASAKATGWWGRRLLRAEPWPLLFVALALLLAYCWWYSYPTVAMVGLNYYGDFCYGFVLFSAIAASRGVQTFMARSCAAYRKLSFDEVRSRQRFWPWLAAIIAVTFVAVDYEVPMHAGFYLSRPQFDALADEALANPGNAHQIAGRWAGCHRVTGVEIIDETVIFYLDRPEGNYGFARVPGARSDHIFNLPDKPADRNNHREFPPYRRENYYTDPVGQRIAGDWFVVYSSYWRVKVGWS
jgi:hypothetical protein